MWQCVQGSLPRRSMALSKKSTKAAAAPIPAIESRKSSSRLSASSFYKSKARYLPGINPRSGRQVLQATGQQAGGQHEPSLQGVGSKLLRKAATVDLAQLPLFI